MPDTTWRNPNPPFVVDGYEFPDPDSNLAGDGEFPPFMIFDTNAQDYLPGDYATREAAQAVCDRLNGGYKPCPTN